MKLPSTLQRIAGKKRFFFFPNLDTIILCTYNTDPADSAPKINRGMVSTKQLQLLL
jgi:hypothetical protein